MRKGSLRYMQNSINDWLTKRAAPHFEASNPKACMAFCKTKYTEILSSLLYLAMAARYPKPRQHSSNPPVLQCLWLNLRHVAQKNHIIVSVLPVCIGLFQPLGSSGMGGTFFFRFYFMLLVAMNRDHGFCTERSLGMC